MQEGPSVAANTLQSIGSPDLRITYTCSPFSNLTYFPDSMSPLLFFFPSPAADTVE